MVNSAAGSTVPTFCKTNEIAINTGNETIALENGLTTTTLRDAAQRVISHSTAAGSNVKSSVAHGYDAAGRRTYATYEDALGQAYGYDNAGQVKNVIVNTANPATVNPTASPTHAYNYDPAGNRTSSLDAGITTNYTTNSVNAYTNINNNSISHDPNGNMVNNVNTSYNYDKENRLRTITQNGTTTGYTYDALSRCIESFNNTSPTDNRERYTWSGWTLLNRELFTGTSPTSSFRYTWGLDLSETLEGAGGVGGLLAIERIVGSNTDIRFPHYDANGNIIALTDSTGNVSARYRYDAFGKTLSATDLDSSNWSTHNIHGFSTKPTFGNTSLLYYGYRFYTPVSGRWLNRDPIEESGGLNLYGFVGNDGVNQLDRLGLFLDYNLFIPGVEIEFAEKPFGKFIWLCKTKGIFCCKEGLLEEEGLRKVIQVSHLMIQPQKTISATIVIKFKLGLDPGTEITIRNYTLDDARISAEIQLLSKAVTECDNWLIGASPHAIEIETSCIAVPVFLPSLSDILGLFFDIEHE